MVQTRSRVVSPLVRHEAKILLIVVLASVAASAVAPRAYGTWFLEVAPVAVGLPVLVFTFSRFRLTPLAYRLLAAGGLLIALGAHYTYAEVPLGFWMQDWFGFSRNHYDRIGHVAQGTISAIVVRELLLRLTPPRAGLWLFAIVTFVCLGISGGFEVLEAFAGAISGQAGDAYLGTQGDQLDAQWDMVCALGGAIGAQLLFARIHGRQILRATASQE
jgi:putative membrane protein